MNLSHLTDAFQPNRWHAFRRRRPIVFYAGLAAVACLLVGVIGVVSLFAYVRAGNAGFMPTKAEMITYRNDVGSEVYDRHGTSLGRFYAENRLPSRYADLPEHLVRALIVTEDARFRDHSGVDYEAYGRVLWKSLLQGETDQGGGSTLTQQLIKNAYGRPALGHHPKVDLLLHKVREAILARRMERVMTKDEILERYLNTVSFPGNTYGIAAVSRRYFQKEPAELTVREAACLVASLKATSAYDPRREPKRNAERAERTLRLMAAAGHLTDDELNAALAEPLCLNYYVESAYAGLAPHFTEAVRLRAANLLANLPHPTADRSWNLYTDNLRVVTTLDLRLQQHAEAALSEQLADHQRRFERHLGGRDAWETDASLRSAVRQSARWRAGRARGLDSVALMRQFTTPVAMDLSVPNGPARSGKFTPLDSVKHYLGYLRAGFMALDHADGAIRSWVGGADFNFSRYDHVTGRRQTGSTFKPVVYAAALRDGFSPCHTLDNELRTYGDEDGTWTPRNSNGEYGGRYSMHGALSHSINTAAVRMILETGPDKVVAMARDLGIPDDLPAVPSIALGTVEGTLRDMVGAYATFANGGYYQAPYFISRIETRDGTPVYQHEGARTQVLSELEAQSMLQMLRYVVERGTAGRLRWQHGVTRPTAGKTGTTQHMADGWFIGSTPALTGGVWVGGDNPGVRFRSGHEGNGSRSALPVWAEFLKRVDADPALSETLGQDFPPVAAAVKARFYCPEHEPDEEEMLDSINEHLVPLEDVARDPTE